MSTKKNDYRNQLNYLLSYLYQSNKKINPETIDLITANLISSTLKNTGEIEKCPCDCNNAVLVDLFRKSRQCVYPLSKIKGMDKKLFYINIIDIANKECLSSKKEFNFTPEEILFLVDHV